MTNQKKLLLIDGSSVAFRAFFALYNQIDRFRNNNGLHTNAIYGFHLMLDNLLERIQPTHVLVAFDAGKTTFRTEMFADYKARSEERRVGKECLRLCRSRWSPYH